MASSAALPIPTQSAPSATSLKTSSEPRIPLLSATTFSLPLAPCSFSSRSSSETAASICMSDPISSSSRMIPEKPSSDLSSLVMEAMADQDVGDLSRTLTPSFARLLTRDLVCGIAQEPFEPDGAHPGLEAATRHR